MSDMTQPSKDATMDGEQRLTPRTDAKAMEACGNSDDDAEGQAMVPVRFARELERELLESAERIARLEGERDDARNEAARFAAESRQAHAAIQEHVKRADEIGLRSLANYRRAESAELALAEERRRVVEECAKVCRARAAKWRNGHPVYPLEEREATQCADAISALASSQGTLPDNAQAKCTNSAPSNTEGTGDNAKEREVER